MKACAPSLYNPNAEIIIYKGGFILTFPSVTTGNAETETGKASNWRWTLRYMVKAQVSYR